MRLLDPRIKMRHVLCLLEVVRQGSVARAGGELGMTQPAVSKTLAELETILGVDLFDRSRRSLSLTPYGEMLVRYATPGIATLRQGVDAIEAARQGTNSLAFGALPTVAAELVPRALNRFFASGLKCSVVAESGPSPYLLDQLRTGTIEFVAGRMANPAAMQGLSFEHLYSEELAFVVRPAHPLTGRAELLLEEVAQYRFVMPPKGAIIRPAVDAMLLAAGIARTNGDVETVSNSLGRGLAQQSDAVWIISNSVVARDIEAGQLARLPVDMSTTIGPVGITFRTDSHLSEAARLMIRALRDEAAPGN